MPNTYNDGEILANSFEQLIDATTYIVNSITLTKPSVEITRNGIEGAVAAQRFVENVGTGTMEIQINTSAQNKSLLHEEIDIPESVTISGDAYKFVITEETQNIASGTVRTRTFSIREVLNPA